MIDKRHRRAPLELRGVTQKLAFAIDQHQSSSHIITTKTTQEQISAEMPLDGVKNIVLVSEMCRQYGRTLFSFYKKWAPRLIDNERLKILRSCLIPNSKDSTLIHSLLSISRSYQAKEASASPQSHYNSPSRSPSEENQSESSTSISQAPPSPD